MNREQAKIWAKLSREELEILGKYGYSKHYEELKHFAAGGYVECISDENTVPYDGPAFSFHSEYRKALPEIEYHGLKVRCNPPATMPLREDERYWAVFPSNEEGYACFYWVGSFIDKLNLERGQVFLNESDVQAIVKAKGWVKE